MICPFLFKEECHRYKILAMYEEGKIPEKNITGVEFQLFLTDYHTWICPIFVLEYPQQEGLPGLPKWKPSSRTGVYLGLYLMR